MYINELIIDSMIFLLVTTAVAAALLWATQLIAPVFFPIEYLKSIGTPHELANIVLFLIVSAIYLALMGKLNWLSFDNSSEFIIIHFISITLFSFSLSSEFLGLSEDNTIFWLLSVVLIYGFISGMLTSLAILLKGHKNGPSLKSRISISKIVGKLPMAAAVGFITTTSLLVFLNYDFSNQNSAKIIVRHWIYGTSATCIVVLPSLIWRRATNIHFFALSMALFFLTATSIFVSFNSSDISLQLITTAILTIIFCYAISRTNS